MVLAGAVVDEGAVGAGVLAGEVRAGVVVVGVLDGLVVVGLDLDGRAVAPRETGELAHAPAVSASTASAATTFHERGRLIRSLFLVQMVSASHPGLTIGSGPTGRSC